MKNRFNKFLRAATGNWRTAVFAITSKCNCRCIMCDMHKQTPQTIGIEDARRIIRFLAENRFLTVYFTGGEPTLHPDIIEMVKYANKLGLVTSLTTNGTSSVNLVRNLKEAGLNIISVSLDHWEPEICSKIRGHNGILEKQERVITACREMGLKVYALACLNEFLVNGDVTMMIDYVSQRLKVPLALCYPTTSKMNSFRLDSKLCNEFSAESLKLTVAAFLRSKRDGIKIANMGLYLEDALKKPEEKPNFWCKGGETVVYVDWNGDVYPCFLKPRLFNILDGTTPAFLKNVKCNECMVNCFREPSIIPGIFLSPMLTWKEGIYSRNVIGMYM